MKTTTSSPGIINIFAMFVLATAMGITSLGCTNVTCENSCEEPSREEACVECREGLTLEVDCVEIYCEDD